MKLVVLTFFLGLGFLSKSQVRISGHIENHDGASLQKIEIYRPVNSVVQVWYASREDDISIGIDGSFTKTIPAAPTGTYVLKMPTNKKVSVHIADGTDSVFLAFKKDSAFLLLKHIGGTNGRGNLFLNEARKNINTRLAPIFAGDFTTAALWDSVTAIETDSKEKVAALFNQKQINASFSELLNRNTETLLLNELYSYSQTLLFSKTRKEQAKQIMDSAFRRFYPLRPGQIKTDHSALSNAYKYVRSINEMHIPPFDAAVSKADSSWAAFEEGYDIASQLPEPYREAQLADFIMINYFYLSNPKARNAIVLFSKQYPQSAYTSFFLQAVMGEHNASNSNGLSPAKQQPVNANAAIQFLSATGGLPELVKKEFKGKFVLVDCWATWCKYCIAEFPFYEKHDAFMKDNNIALLFVSFDKPPTDKSWRAMVVSKSIKGSHILAGGRLESDLLDVAGIKAGAPLPLPRYVLVGPDGKILSSDFERPSSPEFISRLKAFITKYKAG